MARRSAASDIGAAGDGPSNGASPRASDEARIRFRRREALAVLKTAPGKFRITIRLDDDLSKWFCEQVHAAGGGSYQTLINTALREYVAMKREPLEATLRRVLLEELPRVAVRGR